MQPRDGLRTVQVGQSARHLEHPVIAAGGKLHCFRRIAKKPLAGRIRQGGVLNKACRGLRVAADMGSAERSIALHLKVARHGDAGGDVGTALAGRRLDEVGGADRRNFDPDIDAALCIKRTKPREGDGSRLASIDLPAPGGPTISI